MPLVAMQDLLQHAHRHRYAVGAFDLINLDFLSGILAAAEAQRAPVILSLAESHFAHFDFELLMAATLTAAQRTPVPCAIHLDHGKTLERAVEAIRWGANGVMVDASHLPFADNCRFTAEVVAMAHACGVCVEGELGYVPGSCGVDAERHPGPLQYTSVEEAQAFVAATGVDCLAVSIGTIHGRLHGLPQLDFERLAAIDRLLGLPLVIHGGTGLSEEQFRRLIELGVTKINYFTALDDGAGATMRAAVAEGDMACSQISSGVRRAVQSRCEQMIALWGGNGRAAEVLAQCRPWREVEHLVLFKPEASASAEAVAAQFAEGRRALAAIPGVRAVRVGHSVRDDARYSHAWLIRFAHEDVIDHYRDHPAHVAFADQRFRPLAPDRLTTDYRLD